MGLPEVSGGVLNGGVCRHFAIMDNLHHDQGELANGTIERVAKAVGCWVRSCSNRTFSSGIGD